MSLAFSRSLRAVDAERSLGGALFWLSIAGFAAAWMAWFCLARVQVLATTDRARLEVSQAGHRVQAPLAGYVVANHQVLDRVVARGEVLLELDASRVRAELQQKQQEQSSARLELAALEEQISALQRVLDRQQGATRRQLEEAAVRKEQAEGLWRFREVEQARNSALRELGAVSNVSAQKSAAEAEQQRREALAAAVSVKRVSADRSVLQAERYEALTALRKQAAVLQGRLGGLYGALRECEREIARRLVRAPIAGRLADLAALTAGTYVHEGDSLSTIVPSGQLHIVAELAAEQALGRIAPGQEARLRLFGFPWTQYGSLPARVQHVAAETREGRMRVELELQPSAASSIQLRHGLAGNLEITLERASPASLALRAAGKRLTATAQRGAP